MNFSMVDPMLHRMKTSLESCFLENVMPLVPSSPLQEPRARQNFGTEDYIGFCLPSLKLTCSMLPAPPSPSITSTLFMNCGKSFGMRLLESKIKALNIRAGAIGHANSWVKHVTPIFFFFTVIFFLERERINRKACFMEMRATTCTYILVEESMRFGKYKRSKTNDVQGFEHCGHMYDLFLLFCFLI